MTDQWPYAPPRSRLDVEGPSGPAPKVWRWYVVYCVFMAVVYVFAIAMGIAFLARPGEMSQSGDVVESYVMGAFCVAIGLPFFVLYVVAPLLPKRRPAWIVGFVAIGIGLTSGCTLPAALPLLLYWMKDDTKAFFGVSSPPRPR